VTPLITAGAFVRGLKTLLRGIPEFRRGAFVWGGLARASSDLDAAAWMQPRIPRNLMRTIWK